MTNNVWHGCLLSAWVMVVAGRAGAGVAAPPPTAPHQVQTRQFQLEYTVNEQSLPLTRVELWYSLDQGASWNWFGLDSDCQSPVFFEASQEGLHGFYLVLENEVGVSAAPPERDTTPHRWAFVDYSRPILQVHPPAVNRKGSDRLVSLHWSAVDEHLSARPIELAYRVLPDGPWQAIGASVANSGMFDWRPPPQVDARLAFRVTVTDRGGNRVDAVTDAVSLKRSENTEPAPPAPSLPAPPPLREIAPGAEASAEQIAQSGSLLQRGILHKERGEYRLAASRFRDALRIHPGRTEALVQLGETLYFQRQYPESVQAYQLAVTQAPGWGQARRGLARSLVEDHRYDDAIAELTRLVEADPEDSEAWLVQGDVAVRRGDQAWARACWAKAESLAVPESPLRERARARLSDLERLAPSWPVAAQRWRP